MKIKRRKTRQVSIGGVKVGGNAVISVQSMTTTDTSDAAATARQIRKLEKAGCEIVRLAVRNRNDAETLREIRKKTNVPLVADIHFNYRLALKALAAGIDAVRLNPGNIHKKEEVTEVIEKAREKKVPIRIGLNSGSLPPSRGSIPARMMNACLRYIRLFEKKEFYDIIVSLKSSDVLETVGAYRMMAEKCDYPFHLGITAAGLPESGMIKSAIGIGTLLFEGIGDTIRVSLTGDPCREVTAGRGILQSLGIRRFYPEIISCPVCGRCGVNLEKIVREVKRRLDRLVSQKPVTAVMKIAVMGCPVNGPGEAKEADVGIAGGQGTGLIFKKGRVIRKVTENKLIDALMKEIKTF